MRDRSSNRNRPPHIDKTGCKEIAWFIGLWVLGVGAVSLLGLAIKLILS